MKRVFLMLMTFVLVFSGLAISKAKAAQFSDVPTSHRFYDDVQYLMEKGVISTTGSKFGVDQKITREEVAVMVSKSVGLNGKQTATKFKDVPSSLASSGYINSAVNAGIISGYPDGTFRPKEIVTRGQMAIFLSRAFKLTEEVNTNFKDMSPSVSSYKYVRQIVKAEITSGYPDNTFRPNVKLTRGQIAAFIARAMQKKSGSVGGKPPKLSDEDMAWKYLTNSGEYTGTRENLIFFHVNKPNKVLEVMQKSWVFDKYSNRWLFKSGQVVDQLWYGSTFNDNYSSNPLFGGILLPIENPNKKP